MFCGPETVDVSRGEAELSNYLISNYLMSNYSISVNYLPL